MNFRLIFDIRVINFTRQIMAECTEQFPSRAGLGVCINVLFFQNQQCIVQSPLIHFPFPLTPDNP